MKKIAFATLFGIMGTTSAFALPSPSAVWECLKSSDPAMESDGDGPAGSNPVLCHLLSYTVKEVSPHALHIDSQFSCLLDGGMRKSMSGSADCLAN